MVVILVSNCFWCTGVGQLSIQLHIYQDLALSHGQRHTKRFLSHCHTQAMYCKSDDYGQTLLAPAVQHFALLMTMTQDFMDLWHLFE